MQLKEIQQLQTKHILYKSKVRSVLYGGNYDEAFFTRQGPVNSWFEAIGMRKYHSEPEMHELIRLQQDLNMEVSRISALHKSGKLEEAFEVLSLIEAASEKFLHLVLVMEQRLRD